MQRIPEALPAWRHTCLSLANQKNESYYWATVSVYTRSAIWELEAMNAENNLRRDAKKKERVCHTGAEGIAMRSYNFYAWFCGHAWHIHYVSLDPIRIKVGTSEGPGATFSKQSLPYGSLQRIMYKLFIWVQYLDEILCPTRPVS